MVLVILRYRRPSCDISQLNQLKSRTHIYFVSDVHLGLDVKDPEGREARFVKFLNSLSPIRTKALYLLGDIWDFWFEYKYVVPKGYSEVFSALTKLMNNGVEVYFAPGNHDRWCFHYLQSLGIRVLDRQPYYFEFGNKIFCVGHGDGLGPGMTGYKMMQAVFKCRTAQWLFSLIHPRLAFSFANRWSKSSRLAKNVKYEFKGADEPLYKFVVGQSEKRPADYYIFGHYHVDVTMSLPAGRKMFILNDWMDESDYLFAYFDGISTMVGHSLKTE